MAAARAWAKPGAGSGSADPEDSYAAVIAAWLETDENGAPSVAPSQIEIAPDEADVVALFFALGTQWTRLIAPMTGAVVMTGLNYSVVPVVAGMLEIGMTPGMFRDLRDMEGAALRAFTGERS